MSCEWNEVVVLLDAWQMLSGLVDNEPPTEVNGGGITARVQNAGKLSSPSCALFKGPMTSADGAGASVALPASLREALAGQSGPVAFKLMTMTSDPHGNPGGNESVGDQVGHGYGTLIRKASCKANTTGWTNLQC